MGGMFRTTVLFLSIAAIALGCYDIANPYRFGMFGYDNTYFSNGDQFITRIYPDSPVERAASAPAIWSYETGFAQRCLRFQLPAHEPANRLTVAQNGKVRQMHIVTATYKYVKPIEEGPLEALQRRSFGRNRHPHRCAAPRRAKKSEHPRSYNGAPSLGMALRGRATLSLPRLALWQTYSRSSLGSPCITSCCFRIANTHGFGHICAPPSGESRFPWSSSG